MELKLAVGKYDDIVELKLAVGKYDDIVELKLAVGSNDGNVVLILLIFVASVFNLVNIVLVYVDVGK